MDLADGPRLTFEVSGAHAGPQVLLLRPIRGLIAGLGALHAALVARLRVIDLDGAEPAEPPAPAPAWSSRAMGRGALAILNQLGVPRSHVLGLGSGAMVAAWLAIDAPQRVARVCLVAAPPTSRALLRVHHARAPVLFLVGAREEPPSEALLRAASALADPPRFEGDPRVPSPIAEPPRFEGEPSDPPGAFPLDRALQDPRAVADRALRFFLDAEAVTLRARGR